MLQRIYQQTTDALHLTILLNYTQQRFQKGPNLLMSFENKKPIFVLEN
jgi:hypothetical protein